MPKGNWWEVFGDTNLNELEAQALQANQELKAAVARVDQARATARVARSELMPSLSLDPSFDRQRYSPNANPSFGNITANTFSTPLDLSYEVDLWGRVRRGFQGARADAQASLADYYNVLLTLQSDVAQNYFALRSLDAEIATVNGTVDLRQEQVRLVRSRFEGGIGSELDVAQAETELATTEAEAAQLAHRRDELENAIAILVGENPSVSIFAASADDPNWNPPPPEIPAGLPSDLLERRPDVATAERQLASANARSAWPRALSFPVLTLTGSGGYVSGDLDSAVQLGQPHLVHRPEPVAAHLCRRPQPGELQAIAGGLCTKPPRFIASRCSSPLAMWRTACPASAIWPTRRRRSNAPWSTPAAPRSWPPTAIAPASSATSRWWMPSRDALSAERANAQLAGQRLIAAVQLIKALGGGWEQSQIFANASAAGVNSSVESKK